MAIALDEALLREAHIGSFFRPSQLGPLGIRTTRSGNWRRTSRSSAWGAASIDL